MAHQLLAVIIISLHFTNVAPVPLPSILPQCSETKVSANEVFLKCSVLPGKNLDYRNIREYTAATQEGTKFNVTITCLGGHIYLPWPFFAKNVVSLEVSGCESKGFLADRFESNAVPTELKYISLKHLRILITIKDLYDSVLSLYMLTEQFECGPVEAEVQIFQNIEYVFPEQTGSPEEKIMLEQIFSSDSLQQLVNHKSVCTYPHLKYLELSSSRTISAIHFKLEESNHYPTLETYSMKNNSLKKIPAELKNLHFAFMPVLTFLDLSHNGIKDLDFLISGQRSNLLYVNMSRNDIKDINKMLVKQIGDSKKIFFDIRENPLNCSCELLAYGQYLVSNSNIAHSMDIYRETTCFIDNKGLPLKYRLPDVNPKHLLC